MNDKEWLKKHRENHRVRMACLSVIVGVILLGMIASIAYNCINPGTPNVTITKVVILNSTYSTYGTIPLPAPCQNTNIIIATIGTRCVATESIPHYWYGDAWIGMIITLIVGSIIFGRVAIIVYYLLED